MTRARTGLPPAPSRYMTFAEVARELGYKSRSPVYDLVHVHKKLTAVRVGPKGSHRITRASFDEFCTEIEAEAARRGLGAA